MVMIAVFCSNEERATGNRQQATGNRQKEKFISYFDYQNKTFSIASSVWVTHGAQCLHWVTHGAQLCKQESR